MLNLTGAPIRSLFASKYELPVSGGIGLHSGVIADTSLPLGTIFSDTARLSSVGYRENPGEAPFSPGRSGLTDSYGTYFGISPDSLSSVSARPAVLEPEPPSEHPVSVTPPAAAAAPA